MQKAFAPFPPRVTLRRLTLLATICLSALVGDFSCLRALTAEELAGFLGVHSWETIVDLPSKKFQVEVFQVKDGQISGRLVGGDSTPETNPARRVLIMISAGNVPGTVKGSLGLGGYGVTGQEHGPLDDPKSGFGSISLPRHITVGDRVLGGGFRVEDGHTVVSNRVSDLTCGFLLRVTALK